MRASIEDGVLYLDAEDMPRYKKGGSVVRNSYFWALRSIAARSPFDKPWEFEQEVWFALNRMLLSFFESGYLGTRETQLEFLDGTEVPEYLRPASTWVATFDELEEAELAPESKYDSEASSRPRKQARPSRRGTKTLQKQLSRKSTPKPPESEKDSYLVAHQTVEETPSDSASSPGPEPAASDPQTPLVPPSTDQSPQPRRRSWRSTRLG